MLLFAFARKKNRVALRKESVDRNIAASKLNCLKAVALRKESVDRNISSGVMVG